MRDEYRDEEGTSALVLLRPTKRRRHVVELSDDDGEGVLFKKLKLGERGGGGGGGGVETVESDAELEP